MRKGCPNSYAKTSRGCSPSPPPQSGAIKYLPLLIHLVCRNPFHSAVASLSSLFCKHCFSEVSTSTCICIIAYLPSPPSWKDQLSGVRLCRVAGEGQCLGGCISAGGGRPACRLDDRTATGGSPCTRRTSAQDGRHAPQGDTTSQESRPVGPSSQSESPASRTELTE